MADGEHSSQLRQLLDTVVEGGYCIGCGVCAALPDSPIKIVWDEHGRYVAELADNGPSGPDYPVLSVCPFADGAPNEDALATELFPNIDRHPHLGHVLSTYAGYVVDGSWRSQGSSGGMVSWVLCRLLDDGLVDYVVHVHPVASARPGQKLFEYRIVDSSADVQTGSKSRYYPVELSHVLKEVRRRPGRYAFVAVPCFVKALRLVARQDPVLCERIRFCVGLVCGHLKSKHFASMLAWQCGIAPSELTAIDFRKKQAGRLASDYAVEAVGIRNSIEVRAERLVRDLYGSNWGYGFFRYHACDFCDDVVAELADISFGDAWLPQYVADGNGTNVVIVRDGILQQLLLDGKATGAIHLDDLPREQLVQSQAGGFRDRREGLAFRLHLKRHENVWFPNKRVKPSSEMVGTRRGKIYATRLRLSSESHVAFSEALKANDFRVFRERMEPLSRYYDSLYSHPLCAALSRLKRLARIIIGMG